MYMQILVHTCMACIETYARMQLSTYRPCRQQSSRLLGTWMQQMLKHRHKLTHRETHTHTVLLAKLTEPPVSDFASVRPANRIQQMNQIL